MSKAKFFGYAFGLAAAIAALHKGPPVAENKAIQQKLTLEEEDGRVALAWSGPIDAPMRQEFDAVVEKYRGDPRPFVLSLNSPGGSVEHGREVMAALREAAKTHEIDTLVGAGGVCASMCLPIYLLGHKREAAASAVFMFHEAHLVGGPIETAKMDEEARLELRRLIEGDVTDILYRTDFAGERVNAQWLAGIRRRIVGRDVWKTAQQLTDEGSGVVDALIP